MGLLLRRAFAFIAALVVMGGFYAFAVLVEGGQDRRAEEFLVREDPVPMTPMEEIVSDDARVLTRAFGASMPVPGAPLRGSVVSGSYHGYGTRIVRMQGAAGSVAGIRPASAAPSIMPADAVFLSGGEALLGFPALESGPEGQKIFALLTADAAFLIIPNSPEGLSGFAPGDP